MSKPLIHRVTLVLLAMIVCIPRRGIGFVHRSAARQCRPAERLLKLFEREKGSRSAREEQESYDYHLPVLLHECCDHLDITENGVYVDCTLGGGGHTSEILKRGGHVIGLDQDPDAIAHTSERLNDYIANGKLDIVKTNFRNICAAVRGSSIWKHIRCSDGDDTVLSNNEGGDVHDDSDLKVDGVLMDLGISSFQIDEGARGFAFGADGPLDMRMGKHSSESSLTAAEIINSWDASKIADMLYLYGDERRSRQIAREITLRRPLNTTFELEQAISRVTPYKHRSVTLARCFQAIRIVVNDEISALEEALESVQEIVKPGGKLVILSYHSLEDRRVKNVMKFGKVDRDEESYHHDGLITSQRPASPWATVYKKALVPNDEEIARNRRSRSAKLRIAERVGTVSGSTQSSSSEGAEYTEKRRRKSYPVIGAKQRAKLAAQQHEDEAMVE